MGHTELEALRLVCESILLIYQLYCAHVAKIAYLLYDMLISSFGFHKNEISLNLKETAFCRPLPTPSPLQPVMSTRAKITLGGSFVFCGLTIWGVHYLQRYEKEVITLQC